MTVQQKTPKKVTVTPADPKYTQKDTPTCQTTEGLR